MTPTLSVDAFQVTPIDVWPALVVCRLAGVDGGAASRRARQRLARHGGGSRHRPGDVDRRHAERVARPAGQADEVVARDRRGPDLGAVEAELVPGQPGRRGRRGPGERHRRRADIARREPGRRGRRLAGGRALLGLLGGRRDGREVAGHVVGGDAERVEAPAGSRPAGEAGERERGPGRRADLNAVDVEPVARDVDVVGGSLPRKRDRRLADVARREPHRHRRSRGVGAGSGLAGCLRDRRAVTPGVIRRHAEAVLRPARKASVREALGRDRGDLLPAAVEPIADHTDSCLGPRQRQRTTSDVARGEVAGCGQAGRQVPRRRERRAELLNRLRGEGRLGRDCEIGGPRRRSLCEEAAPHPGVEAVVQLRDHEHVPGKGGQRAELGEPARAGNRHGYVAVTLGERESRPQPSDARRAAQPAGMSRASGQRVAHRPRRVAIATRDDGDEEEALAHREAARRVDHPRCPRRAPQPLHVQDERIHSLGPQHAHRARVEPAGRAGVQLNGPQAWARMGLPVGGDRTRGRADRYGGYCEQGSKCA